MSGPNPGIFLGEDAEDVAPPFFAPQAPPPPTGFLENFRASRRATIAAGRTDSRETSLREAYDPIVDALNEGFRKADLRKGWLVSPDADKFFHNPYRGRDFNPAFDAAGGVPVQEQRIWTEIARRRQADANFLRDLGANREEFIAKMNARAAAAFDREGEVRATATTGGTVGSFVGAMVGGFSDPPNVATMLLGAGPSRSILQTAVREAAVNAGVEAVLTPGLVERRKEIDRPMTVGEAVTNVAVAGAIGGTVGAAVEGGRRILGKIRAGKLAELSEAELVQAVDVLGIKDPEVLKARDVLAEKTHVDASNPGPATPEGLTDHAQRIDAATGALLEDSAPRPPSAPQTAAERLASFSEAVGEGQRRQIDSLMHDIKAAKEAPPVAPNDPPAPLENGAPVVSTSASRASGKASLPGDIVQFFTSKGLPEHQARGIAAGIVAESRGDHTIRNPDSDALGLGQWLGSRKAEIERRYGPNPSRRQQLEFMWHELNGGDAGGRHVLAGKDEVSTLNAYIRKFMRPAKGRETDGDLSRGMAALGRGDELTAARGQPASGEGRSPRNSPEPVTVALHETIEDGEAVPIIRTIDDVLAEIDGDDAFVSALEACL